MDQVPNSFTLCLILSRSHLPLGKFSPSTLTGDTTNLKYSKTNTVNYLLLRHTVSRTYIILHADTLGAILHKDSVINVEVENVTTLVLCSHSYDNNLSLCYSNIYNINLYLICKSVQI